MQPDVLAWARKTLTQSNYRIDGDFYPIREVPWSSVYAINTDDKVIYLKQSIHQFDNEAPLLDYLTQQLCHHLPKLIAYNPTNKAFLMQDAGLPLRNIFKTQTYDLHLAEQALQNYTEIQQACILKTEQLIAHGVPDWRLKELPSLYLKLLKNEDLLLADGLAYSDIDALHRLHFRVIDYCNKLGAYPVPETLEHGDFHDNNILLKDHSIIINDWGDAVITHPFFSISSFISSAKRNHNLSSEECNRLEESYLIEWQPFATKEQLKIIMQLIHLLNPIKFSLNFSRISQCIGINHLGEYHGYIQDALKTFIITNEH